MVSKWGRESLPLDQGGFVLVATLGFLVVMMVGAGLFHTWVDQARVEAKERQRRVQFALDAQSTLAVVQYLFATQAVDTAGLRLPQVRNTAEPHDTDDLGDFFGDQSLYTGAHLSLDDRPIQGVGDVLFSCQDAGGLIGLNVEESIWIERLLNDAGVPLTQQQRLLDRLRDYRDQDQLQRLNGAERDEYLKAGLEPPADHDLLSSWELLKVLDWKQRDSLWTQGYLPSVTNVFMQGIPNPNTAPLRVLMVTLGVSTEGAHKIIDRRTQHPITTVSTLQEIVGKPIPFDDLAVSFFPSPYIRISLWSNVEARGRMNEMYLQLLSIDEQNSSPLGVEYGIELPFLRTSESVRTLTEVPFFAQ